jgi:hypothetical protein
MPEIQTVGETSLIFFNKKFSHAVNKKPVPGDNSSTIWWNIQTSAS